MLAVVGALIWAPATAASAPVCGTTGLGLGLLDVPTDQLDDPRARTYVVRHVEPGESFLRRLRICNGTAAAVAVQLYPGAAVVDDGTFRALEGRVGNELSSWTSVRPTSLQLAPGEEKVAQVEVVVPADAADGERYAVVLAELPARAQGGVSVASRVGVRFYVSVGAGPAPTTDFTIRSMQAARLPDRTPVISALVENTGDLALDLRGALRLYDGPGGVTAGPFPVELGRTLAPGDVEPVQVRLDPALPDGPWRARLTLGSGLLERTAEARISFPDQAGRQAAPVAAVNLSPAEDPKVLVPIATSLILLIALLLAWWLLVRRRRRQVDEDATHPG